MHCGAVWQNRGWLRALLTHWRVSDVIGVIGVIGVIYLRRDPAMLRGVLCNSLCHEFDQLTWLWPGSAVEIRVVEPRANSGVFVAGAVRHPAGSATEFEINFSKGHPKHYGQLIVLDGHDFGYPKFAVSV